MAVERAGSQAHEAPAHPLKHRFSVDVLGQLARRVVALSVALHRHPPPPSLDHQIELIGTHGVVHQDPVAQVGQVLVDRLLEAELELGLGHPGGLLLCEQIRVLGVPDQLEAKIPFLEVAVGIQRIDHPHLVAGPAGGHVVALDEHFLGAQGQRAVRGRIHQRQEDHVALVALELGGGAAHHPSFAVFGQVEVAGEQAVDGQSLLLAHHADHAHRSPGILRLLATGGEQRGHLQRLLVVDPLGGLAHVHPVGHRGRSHPDTRALAQGLHFALVAHGVGEGDDLGDRAEVLQQPDSASEGAPRQVVDRGLAVEQLAVGHVLEVAIDERLDGLSRLANLLGADLLVVPHHQHLAPEGESDQAGEVGLAGLVQDDHVKQGLARLVALGHTGDWHDPYGHRLAAFSQALARLGLQKRRPLALAAADLAHEIEPTNQ